METYPAIHGGRNTQSVIDGFFSFYKSGDSADPPADGQHSHLPMVAAALLGLLRRQLPNEGPLLLVAAAADVLLAARSTNGVQVVAGVFRGSRWCTGGQRGHGWG